MTFEPHPGDLYATRCVKVLPFHRRHLAILNAVLCIYLTESRFIKTSQFSMSTQSPVDDDAMNHSEIRHFIVSLLYVAHGKCNHAIYESCGC